MTTINVISRATKTLLTCRSVIYIPSKCQSLWTSDNIVKSPFIDVEIPNITIPTQIWQNLDKWADKPALVIFFYCPELQRFINRRVADPSDVLWGRPMFSSGRLPADDDVCGITNRSYTYHQLYKYSRNFAATLLSKLDVRDGDVVCIMMPNSPEYGLVVLGILQAGAEVTTVNPIYTAHEVSRQLLLSNPKIIIGVSETITVIKEALQLAKKDNLPIIAVKNSDKSIPAGTISLEELALNNNVDHSVLKEVNRKPEDIAFLPYSSGTTGLPKGVELHNRNIITNLVQLNVEKMKHHTDTTSTSQDSVLAILPFFHIYGLTVVLLHKLSVGQKLVTLPKFQPDSFMKALKDHQINTLIAAPPLILFCASHKAVTKHHLEHLKVMTSGAAPLPIHDVRKVYEKCSPDMNFIQLYGLTETSPLATSMIPGEVNYSTSGYAVSNTELKIVDAEMRTLGPNEVGEILIRGPHVMKGYRNNPEATKAAITEDGWFKSGDLAKIDENGAVTIADRLKELIKVKGYQVPPAELESVLREHPSILEAAVVGIPDEKQGEAPKAFVVVKEGHQLKTDDVKMFIEKRVAPYKRVKEVMFLEAIPKNPSGKILRRVLKDQYC